MFQFTHPHRVRLDLDAKGIGADWVSIHAPTQGATPDAPTMQMASSVSIHAPTQGATFTDGRHFTTHICVSIHAPTQGATCV